MINNSELLSAWFKNQSFYSPSNLNQTNLNKTAQKKVINLFKSAAQKVPAYKFFLKKNKINPDKINNILDFNHIPPVDKSNYIDKFKIEDRCWNGELNNMHMISTSSGTTGKPYFWPRNLYSEIEGAYAHEFIFKNIFSADTKKTLFINGFPLGNWIAGTFTLVCTNLCSWKNYPITSITPGYSGETIIELVKLVGLNYKQIIICGHSPFLKEVIELGITQGINWSELNAKFLGTGQMITENWRDYLLKKMKIKDYYHTIISLYGSTDAALIGFETPISIYLRQLIFQKPDLQKNIFNDQRLPSICNYDPRLTYLEKIGKELHITKDMGSPLIRYNIHDEGGILPHKEMLKYFSDKDIKKAPQGSTSHTLPFVYLFGREKFMVKIYGAIVYPEHVQQALTHEKLQPYLTGRCLLEMEYDQNHNPKLICRVELNQAVTESNSIVKITEEIFIKEVRRLNNEYNDAFSKMGERVKPRIITHAHGDPKYFPVGKVKKTA